ncbi:hypothetical protein MP228_002897 [Amoeboaphelidium protococcarum]|nr:hypothetical protein MP228_002897 [Amoeboaphelidium protococcarum]
MDHHKTEWSQVKVSAKSRQTVNPIRNIVDKLKVDPHSSKSLISLSIGDPTVFGNFNPPEHIQDATLQIIKDAKHNGYLPSFGDKAAREAIAQYQSVEGFELSADDVVVTSGCSGALDLIFDCLCEAGSNVLLPKPGFSLYTTLAQSKGVEIRYYDLDPSRGWQVDLEHVKSLYDSRTSFILVNNPSNPCGSVYDESHLREILQTASNLRLPVVADEIYAHMAFAPNQFYFMAQVAVQNGIKIPVLSVGGLAKRYMIPGWRLGWIAVYDLCSCLEDVKSGLVALSQLILGANSITQALVPRLLSDTPKSYYEGCLTQLKQNADLCAQLLSSCACLQIVQPQGAMYMMIGLNLNQFKDIADDADFAGKLLAEENVVVLPGQCFQFKNFFRLVVTVPEPVMREACGRIIDFCQRHQSVGNGTAR